MAATCAISEPLFVGRMPASGCAGWMRGQDAPRDANVDGRADPRVVDGPGGVAPGGHAAPPPAAPLAFAGAATAMFKGIGAAFAIAAGRGISPETLVRRGRLNGWVAGTFALWRCMMALNASPRFLLARGLVMPASSSSPPERRNSKSSSSDDVSQSSSSSMVTMRDAPRCGCFLMLWWPAFQLI